MFPSSFRRVLHATPFLAATAAIVGCNALLDNQPGDLREDVSPTSPDPESAPGDGAERDGGASGSSAPQPSTDRDDDAGTDAATGTTDSGGALCELCAPPHATAACVAGACAVGSCAAGFADCNGVAADGCEADVSRVTSCGACGVVCPAGPHYQPTCTGGVCAGVCVAGFADCNADPLDGCETNLLNERLNCGACGRICIVGKCKAGTCAWAP